MNVEIAQSVLIPISITIAEGKHHLIVLLGGLEERKGKTHAGFPELAVPGLEGTRVWIPTSLCLEQ